MLDRTTQDRWDARYREAGLPGAPATVLLENAHLMPRAGTALDLACGLGANALLLGEVKDALRDVIPPAQFDVVVVTHYLERALTRALVLAVNVGGLLFYQTFTATAVVSEGPERPEWRLADGELLSMFAPLRPLVYREEGRVGDLAQGFRNKALLVAIKDPHRGDCMIAMQD